MLVSSWETWSSENNIVESAHQTIDDSDNNQIDTHCDQHNLTFVGFVTASELDLLAALSEFVDTDAVLCGSVLVALLTLYSNVRKYQYKLPD